MDPSFEAFANSIGLSDTDAQIFKAHYESRAPVHKPSLACLATQLALGREAVETAPLSQAVIEVNWSQVNVATPHCVVRPTSAHAVSIAIRVLAYFQVRFAVRSGGHSPTPGASSIGSDGILLDLSNLDGITLGGDRSVVGVGSGQRWGKVFSFLDAYGLSVIGGRVPSVGVGGLILGDGLHHFSAKYGLAADNVHNFEVALSDGTITNANAKENADLFWALKGGGPNFGVVTRFDLYTVPARTIWLRLTIHAVDQAEACIDAFTAWQQSDVGASDARATVLMGIGLDSIILGLIYAVDEHGEPAPGTEQPPAGFAPFYDLPVLQTLADGVETPLSAFMDQVGAATTSAAPRHDYRAASSRVDAQLYKDVYAVWRPRALAVREATGAEQTFVLQPVPKSVARVGAARGGNAMGIPDEDHQWWTTLVDWTDPAHDDQVRAVSIETTRQWEKLGRGRGLHLPFLYQDDCSRDQNPLASSGEENLAKLRQVALKYDKSQFFPRLQNGGFVLSKA